MKLEFGCSKTTIETTGKQHEFSIKTDSKQATTTATKHLKHKKNL